MPQLLRCTGSHEWTSPDGEKEANQPLCPVCGAAPVTDPAWEATLPPPGPASDPQPGEVAPETLAPPPLSPSSLLPPGALAETLCPPPIARTPGVGQTLPPLGETLAPPPSSRSSAPPVDELPTRAGTTDAPETVPPTPDNPSPAGGTHRPRTGGATQRMHGVGETRGAESAPVGTARVAAERTGRRDPEQALQTLGASGFGPTIPGYRILGELGRGGMGVVYKAEQIGLNRLVALKMILSGGYAGAADLARFRLEAEAVAKVQHPNIVAVYEINECDGKPYFCLEFVDGGPLDKKLAGNPLPARDAARMMQKLAQGMDYAHQRHIIHRDLKPPNVLLTRDGEPKITDFGLAKKMDDQDSQTQSGSIMGTPSYMPPEQAEGKTADIGPLADIYSLGAILYELLTGRPPFKGATILDTLEQVRTREPVPPSRLQPKVPHDLETICLKCLQKEPTRRYASAGELADDLGRYLAGEPIRARPTPLWERAAKWCRRRPALAGLVGVSALAVIGLVVGGLLYGRLASARADAERQRAEQERLAAEEARCLQQIAEDKEREAQKQKALADRQRRRAEANLRDARAAVDELTEIGQRRLANDPSVQQVRRDILEKVLHFHHHFLEVNGQDPALRFETARAQFRAGSIEELLGRQGPAEKAYRAALAMDRVLLQEQPGARRVRQDLAASWDALALLCQATGREEEADRAFQEALALEQGLVKEFPRSRVHRRDLAATYNNRGAARQARQRLREAEGDYAQALKLFEQLTLDFPLAEKERTKASRGAPEGEEEERARYRQELARTYSFLGAVWTALSAGREAPTPGTTWAVRAEEAYGKAERLWSSLAKRFPAVPHYRAELAATHLNRGTLRHAGRRGNEALADYQEAIGRLSRLAEQFRSVPDYRRLLANAYVNLGQLYRSANQPHEAEKVWRLSLPVLATLAAEFPKERNHRQLLGRSHNELAIALAQQHSYKEAEKSFGDAIGVLEALVREAPAEAASWKDLIDAHTNRTGLLVALSRTTEAAASARALVAAQERRLKAFPKAPAYLIDLARSEGTLADILRRRNQDEEARQHLENAVRHARAALEGRPKATAYRRALCGHALALIALLLDDGDHAAAGRTLRELLAVVPLVRNVRGRVSPEEAALLLGRCLALAEKDKKLTEAQRKELRQTYGDEAVKLLRQAVAGGYKDGQALKNAEELAPLRPRLDFQQILRGLSD